VGKQDGEEKRGPLPSKREKKNNEEKKEEKKENGPRELRQSGKKQMKTQLKTRT